MIVYKVCKKIEDGKYKSAIVTKKYVIIYELGKTICRKLMLPLIFKTIEDAERFSYLAFTRRSTDIVILKCKASGLVKINILVDFMNEEKFRNFWHIYKKMKYDRTTVSFRENNLYTYNAPMGTFGAEELTPLEEISC